MDTKKKSFILVAVIVLLIALGFVGYSYLNKEDKPSNNNDNIDDISSKEATPPKVLSDKEQLEQFLISLGKEVYNEIELADGTEVLLNLEDIEKVYEKDIDKYKDEKFGCDLKHTFLKVTVKDGKNNYSANINCQGLAE